MDPNTALATLRKLIGEWQDTDSVNVDELTEAFQGLDEWLSGGGFMPSDWQG